MATMVTRQAQACFLTSRLDDDRAAAAHPARHLIGVDDGVCAPGAREFLGGRARFNDEHAMADGGQVAQHEQTHEPRAHQDDLRMLAEREHLQAADDTADRLGEGPVQQ